MPAKWIEAKVINITSVTNRIRKFYLQLNEEECFSFLPGQFITFDLPISEKRLQRWKSYSIANRPDGSNVLELCIVHLDGGLGSGYFFDEVVVGTVLKFKGPDGVFTLTEPLDYDLVMLCTGTGVAPFKSMIDHIFHNNIPHKKLHLIFGTRKEEDIVYRKEFEEYAASHPEFSYDIVLSQQTDWPGHKGHIHQVYMKEYEQTRADLKFMICGWNQMTDQAVENLTHKCNYPAKQVHCELYG